MNFENNNMCYYIFLTRDFTQHIRCYNIKIQFENTKFRILMQVKYWSE